MEDSGSVLRTVITDGVTFMESPSPKYHDRTVENARWADLTVAFAVDFSTPGERLTREAAGERYLAVRLPSTPMEFHDPECQKRAAELLYRRSEGLGRFRLNVAGNGLETLKKAGFSQGEADEFVRGVVGYALAMGSGIAEVRSGGQSGADESGIRAAVSYGTPAAILFPRGWLWNDADGHPHWNREAFMRRFEDIPRLARPELEFDVQRALSGRDSTSYRPGTDSILPGVAAGDVIGAPYLRDEPSGEDFEFFSAVRSRDTDGNAVFRHPSPSAITGLASVLHWWAESGTMDDGSLSRSAAKVPGVGEMSPVEVAAAVSVLGLSASSMTDVMDLSDRALSALGRSHGDGQPAEAAAMAVFLASHGRTRDDLAFTMKNGYGFDLSEAAAGICAAGMRRGGSTFREISSELLQRYGVQVAERAEKDGDRTVDDILPRVRVLRESSALVNGERYSWTEPTGRRNTRSEDGVPLALACFLETSSFEQAVRRAVSLGGHSPALAALAGSVAAAYYGGVPDRIAARCLAYIPDDVSRRLVLSEDRGVRPAGEARGRIPSAEVHTFGGERFAVVPKGEKELLAAVRAAGMSVVSGGEVRKMLREAREGAEETGLEGRYAGSRRLYLHEGRLVGISSLDVPGLPSLEDRRRSRLIFEDLSRFAEGVRRTLEHRSGYDGEVHLRYRSAYYPSVGVDRISVMEGDLLAGAVCLDQATGLLRVEWGGDYRDGEYRDADWCRERVFDPASIVTLPAADGLGEGWKADLRREGIVMGADDMRSLATLMRRSSSYTEDLDGLKSAIARFCLDEGMGVGDDSRTSNLEKANADVAALRDSLLNGSGAAPEREVSVHDPVGDDLYNAMSRPSEGYSVVRRDGLYNLRSSDGTVLLKSWYPEVTPFEHGIARVRSSEGLWTYIDRSGCCITGRWFESASPFRDGRASVVADGKTMQLDRDGNLHEERAQAHRHGI